STEAALLTNDPKTAASLRTLLVDLMNLATKEIAKEGADEKILAHVAKIAEMLTPKLDKHTLSWKMGEDELIQGVKPFVTQIKAGARSAQSVNNLKQLGLAMHNYLSTY